MLYCICYKNKVLVGPLTKEAAEIKLLALSKCFINLRIAPYAENDGYGDIETNLSSASDRELEII